MTEHGMRIAYKGHIGTIRFIGPVEGTSGTWLGIEWDDPTRGKHDGSKDGKRYFTCLVPGAGSFLRPSADICYGKSFLAALRAKYVEAQHGSESQELIILGSSKGAIQVEAVNLDKIREKLANLSSLREVSLDGEMVASSEPPGTVHGVCPNIRGLDLSKNLIHSWDTISAIARELPSLQKLYINQNRFQRPTNADSVMGCFNSLTELRLNNTLMLWHDTIKVIAAMPKLQDLEVGHNRLTNDSFGSGHSLRLNTSVRTINLENNEISGWEGICSALLELSFLERVILTNNKIKNIPFPTSQRRMLQLKSLSLSYNGLKLWSDLSALAAWAPSLQSLTLNGNPIVNDHGQSARPLILARWATLKILDGAGISARERRDAELYYLSYIVNHGPKSENKRCQEYPRWQDLCSQHGLPDETSSKAMADTLQSRLLELRLYRSSALASPDVIKEYLKEGTGTMIRVLPTMTLKSLRSKVRKTLSLRGNITVTMFMVMNDNTLHPLEEDCDSHDIDWIGLQNHSQILCLVG